jgi:CHAT domain-containing protein
LHLSTHASTADGGWIAFAGNKEEARLYLPELYPLKLNAAMAVLSACETAAGKLSRGEGVLSIAHGLSYAGCPSTVASLWPAYHSTSSEIMLHFFRALQSGESKDEALRNAKLDYLEDESTDASGAHPALWAAFVHMGVPDPLYGRGVDFRAWLIAGLAVLLLLAGFFYRRSRG